MNGHAVADSRTQRPSGRAERSCTWTAVSLYGITSPRCIAKHAIRGVFRHLAQGALLSLTLAALVPEGYREFIDTRTGGGDRRIAALPHGSADRLLHCRCQQAGSPHVATLVLSHNRSP